MSAQGRTRAESHLPKAHHRRLGVTIEPLMEQTWPARTRRPGGRVDGAGVFRDAVRSTIDPVVYALGLNLVVVTLRVTPRWGRTPIAIPVNARLHGKNDAAIYDKAPPRTGKRGRPRTKGGRVPTPEDLASSTDHRHWQTVTVDERGTTGQRLVHVLDVLWYSVNKHDPLRLVIVGDLTGAQPDDFFITQPGRHRRRHRLPVRRPMVDRGLLP